jgi:hypothetical protein
MMLTIIGSIIFAGNAFGQNYKSDMLIQDYQTHNIDSEIILDKQGYINLWIEGDLIIRAFITDSVVTKDMAMVMALDLDGYPYLFTKKNGYILFEDGDYIVAFILTK